MEFGPPPSPIPELGGASVDTKELPLSSNSPVLSTGLAVSNTPVADPSPLLPGRFNGSEFEQPASGIWKPQGPVASSPGRLGSLLEAGLGSQEFTDPTTGVWNATLQLKVNNFCIKTKCFKGLSLEMDFAFDDMYGEF